MKIAIIGAMEEEVAILRNQIESSSTDKIANSEYTSGKLKGADVVLLKSGIGKVNAAMSTAVLLYHYQPDVVINTGSAGGLNPELQVGDIVISTEVRHHDVDATVFGYEYGQVPQMPAAYLADKRLIETAARSAETLTGVQVVKGLITTGDSFMSDPDRVESIRHKWNDLQAVEMEAAAIAQVCYQFGTPFVIIRSLSDIAGKESNISFDQYLEKAARNSAELVVKMVESLK
ncbi:MULTISPECIES: 5'-methylthioadenosine/S-adenosylhomocysteine nucleosidase [Bacillus]|uniref:5'-methylthioadenosine/S-adenosylhomocysteine nucleosidase n=1 Tax=Bacillus TaxID=1386 RepID=UPI00065DD317|nr:5'-methylthioadenosine/S-adenosylhomocysteine nucleosidase [Bacillus smithii]AKP47898.1 S-adenosylhomocysteine nucleosidase [Bacillus smithii]MED4884608.1 5'-methylthioadenosine/S-adenosylhomocysteine nucleosidase [Bacillus smithii]MED4926087.1 5'-methylthioadenosine/S-adenosylhomocysteine nucleosidase [Bacillus smithii]